MKTCRVVWVGDSITAGNHVSSGEEFPALVVAQIPSLDSHNISVPSSTCDSASQGAAADALYDGTKDVNLCVILFGANDGVTKSAATFESDLASFVAARRSTGFLDVILTMLPCGSYDSVAFRAAINANALSTYPRVVDIGSTATTMGAEAAKNDGSLYSDTVHPTAAGNVLLEPAITAAIRSLLVSLPAQDPFTGTNGTSPPNANWTNQNGVGLQITSNHVGSGSGGSYGFGFWNADAFNDDQYSQFVYLAGSGGPSVRASVDNCYWLDINDSGGSDTFLWKRIGGSFTLLQTFGVVFSANDVGKIQIVGSTIKCFRNGVQIGTDQPSGGELTSGAAGGGALTTAALDDFEGGNVAAGILTPVGALAVAGQAVSMGFSIGMPDEE